MKQTELLKLRNVGLRSCQWLQEVGIDSPETLRKLGAAETFVRVRHAGFHPSLNLLYALEGAIKDCHWTALDHDCRSHLLAMVEQQEQSAA